MAAPPQFGKVYFSAARRRVILCGLRLLTREDIDRLQLNGPQLPTAASLPNAALTVSLAERDREPFIYDRPACTLSPQYVASVSVTTPNAVAPVPLILKPRVVDLDACYVETWGPQLLSMLVWEIMYQEIVRS